LGEVLQYNTWAIEAGKIQAVTVVNFIKKENSIAFTPTALEIQKKSF
jgi:hypothetical protein